MNAPPARIVWPSIVATALVLAMACAERPHFREVEIESSEYSYHVPTTLPAGLTAFGLVNRGAVRHEVQIFRFRPGISAHDAAKLLASDTLLKDFRDSSLSVLVVESGQRSGQRVLVDMRGGEVYGLRCTFQNADTLPRHVRLGMFAVVTVE